MASGYVHLYSKASFEYSFDFPPMISTNHPGTDQERDKYNYSDICQSEIIKIAKTKRFVKLGIHL